MGGQLGCSPPSSVKTFGTAALSSKSSRHPKAAAAALLLRLWCATDCCGDLVARDDMFYYVLLCFLYHSRDQRWVQWPRWQWIWGVAVQCLGGLIFGFKPRMPLMFMLFWGGGRWRQIERLDVPGHLPVVFCAAYELNVFNTCTFFEFSIHICIWNIFIWNFYLEPGSFNQRRHQVDAESCSAALKSLEAREMRFQLVFHALKLGERLKWAFSRQLLFVNSEHRVGHALLLSETSENSQSVNLWTLRIGES